MYQIYCPVCGGALSLDSSHKTARCKHCGNEVIIPKGYTELESSFCFAMEARLRKDFASAEDAYTEILKHHLESAAAHWGRALSRYGVEYQPLTDDIYRLVCHQALLQDFASDEDVLSAIQLADGKEKEQYLSESAKITALQAEVSKQAALTMPYDVLIEADPRQKRSLECAEQILANLRAAGLRAICPALEMEEMPRQGWEPMVYQAFTTASYMVYIAVGKEAFSPDMVFDAKRFLYQKTQAQRMAAAQIPQLYLVHAQLDEYEDIPDDLFDHLDARLPMDDPAYLTDLCDRIIGAGQDYSSAIRQETGSKEDFEYSNLLRQGHSYREAGRWEEAKKAYDEILTQNSKESQAYWGMTLLDMQCRNEEELIEKGQSVRENANYKAAVLFANEREQQTYRKVAEDTDIRAQILKNQDEEDARKKEQADRTTQEKAEEIEEAKKVSQKKEQKARKRGKLIAKIAIGLLVVAAIVGWQYKKHYDSTVGVSERLYQMAKEQYNNGNYDGAADDFLALGDYKNSKELYEDCMDAIYQKALKNARKQYEDALLSGEEIADASETGYRFEAVETIREVLEYIPEGQEVLDRWYQEAKDCYAQGEDMHLAMGLLEPWAAESDEFLATWREWFAMGLVTCGDVYDGYAFIRREDGLVHVVDHPELLIEEETVSRCVDMSCEGDSGAVVRMDGTVYVMGALARRDGMTNHVYREQEWPYENYPPYVRADVPGWKNIVSVQVGMDEMVGLKEDGTLISLNEGTLATDIAQFYLVEERVVTLEDVIFQTYVIAITKEGNVFSTVEGLAEELSDWTDLVSISMRKNHEDDSFTVLAVNSQNQLLIYNGDEYYDKLPKEDVAFVVEGSNDIYVITRDAVLHVPGMIYDAGEDVYFYASGSHGNHKFDMGVVGPYLGE